MKSIINQILNEDTKRPNSAFWYKAHNTTEKIYFFLHDVKKVLRRVKREDAVQDAIDICKKMLDISYPASSTSKSLTVQAYHERMPEADIKAFFNYAKQLGNAFDKLLSFDVTVLAFIASELKVKETMFMDLSKLVKKELMNA